MKRVVQTYKPVGAWVMTPPGLGDFVRGICHAFEVTEELGLELRIDVSQTEFDDLIDFDETFFQRGVPAKIAAAEERFVDNIADFRRRLVEFQNSTDSVFYVSTTVGAWERDSLPPATRAFVKKFFQFREAVHAANVQAIGREPYAVLSIRCGDEFFSRKSQATRSLLRSAICDVIDKQILPTNVYPIVVTSDSFQMKRYLAERYGMRMLDYPSQHGAKGNVLPVARDLDLVKHSSFNYHINAWMPWWSGFSHYTSMVFGIPELNIAGPIAAPRRGWLRIISRKVTSVWQST